MKNRRSFLKKSAVSIAYASFFPTAHLLAASKLSTNTSIVKQPEDGETFLVRDKTPITFTISKKKDNVGSISMCYEELVPGSNIPIHKHLNEDEYFYVTAGSGIFIIDETEFPVKPGTTVFVEKGTWHGFKNNGKESVVFTFGYSPAGFEDFFRQIGTPVGQIFKPKPADEFKELARKFGIVYK